MTQAEWEQKVQDGADTIMGDVTVVLRKRKVKFDHQKEVADAVTEGFRTLVSDQPELLAELLTEPT